jgi:predicted nucleic acid-binding protein
MSAVRSFFDTNILLYIYSTADAEKRRRATDLYREQAMAGAILVSTQVVQEFYVAGSRKLALPAGQIRVIAEALMELPLVIVTPAHIRTAMEHEGRYQISFWDSLILAAAEAGGAEVLYTEDLNDGQQYGSVLVRNPFRQA